MRKITNKLKNHFIPHKGNGHEPHFLRHKSLTIILLLIILVEVAFLFDIFVIFKKESFLASVLPGVLTNLTNQARSENGVLPLSENDLLVKSAQLKADDMAKKGYFAHTSPEGITPWYWLTKTGYKYNYAGENLAVNFFESEDVARAWMASPTHRANIVRREFTEIGIATAKGVYQGHEAVFVVQFFGKPVAEKPKPILTDAEINKTDDKPATLKVATIPKIKTETLVLGEETTNTREQVAPTETIDIDTTTIENPETVKSKEEVNEVYNLATSPRKTVNNIFTGILSVVLVALALFIWKSEKKHPEVILQSLALIFVILALLVLNQKTLNIDTITPDNSTANVIAS